MNNVPGKSQWYKSVDVLLMNGVAGKVTMSLFYGVPSLFRKQHQVNEENFDLDLD